MTHKAQIVSQTLRQIISEMSSVSWLYSRRPGHDFTRKSVLGFEETISILLAMEGKSLNNELLKFFNCSENTPTASAFVQCRSKLLPEAMEILFQRFAAGFGSEGTYKGYRLMAIDGSDIQIPVNPDDHDSFFPTKEGVRPRNLIHLNAMYDLINRTYSDAVIEGSQVYNEQRALTQMVDRSKIMSAILIADRGYEAYNTLAHVQEKGWKFLFRVKDGTGGIVSGLDLPDEDEFDIFFDLCLTNKKTNAVKELLKDRNHYKKIHYGHQFDYLPLHNRKKNPTVLYRLSFRVVRFRISDSLVETIITNLDSDNFPPNVLKKLYNMRWGIETSFRCLKYTVGLLHFHAKKVEHILQEVFARLIMYNYSELIISCVIVQNGGRKHTYKVNFTAAVQICRQLLCGNVSPPNVETLIAKYLLPIRPSRSYSRKPSTSGLVSFTYRIA